MPRRNTVDDFWNNCEEKSSGCWEWSMSKSKSGYGKTTWKNKGWRSHRLAFYLTYNKIPKVVMHKCDNGLCCNPFHLTEGSHKLNMKDMAVKGRAARQAGVTHGQNKYSNEFILSIREDYGNGESQSFIGRKYNINRSYIGQIVLRKRWTHI